MAKNTIVMWGSGRNSEDTKRKLRIYDDYRKTPSKRDRLYSDTVIFEQPFDDKPINMPVPVYPDVGSRSSWTFESRFGYENLSAKKKRDNYKSVYGDDLDTLFDYEPYVDLAILPTNKRPHSFVQCIDFFYPMSGKNSYIPTQSPLVSTWPNAYDNEYRKYPKYSPHLQSQSQGNFLNTNPKVDAYVLKDSTMPVDLGEIAMMYFWFNIYKLLLCPAKFQYESLPAPESIFDTDINQRRSVYPELIASGQRGANAALRNLNNLQKTFAVISKVANKVASDESLTDFDIERDLKKLQSEAENIFTKGITKIATAFSNDAGIDLLDANTIVDFFTSGSISPKALKSLSSSGLDTLAVNINRSLSDIASQKNIDIGKLSKDDRIYLNAFARFGSNFKDAKLSDLSPNLGENSNAKKDSLSNNKHFLEILKNPNSYNRLSSNAKQIVAELKSNQTTNVVSVKDAFQNLKNARPNGLISFAVITGSKMAFNAYISHRTKEINNLAREIRTWASTTVARLDPRFAEEEIEFVIDNQFSLGNGVKSGGGLTGNKNWKLKPTCGIVLGRQFERYCIEAYANLKNVLEAARAWYNGKFTMEGFNLNDKLGTLIVESGDANSATWITNRGYCKPFDLFASNEFNNVPRKSTKIVFNDLQSFSPFTQAFGWEPTFLSKNTSDSNGKKELNPTRNTYDVGVFGSPVNKGKVFGTYKYGAWIAPGQIYKYTTVTSHDDGRRNSGSKSNWITHTLQNNRGNYHEAGKTSKGRHQKTVNSQRKLNSAVPYAYGGFTDLNFDVATGVPIFNAQWVAATSVIFCYAEALKNLADMGYGWAAKLYREKPKMAQMDDSTLKAMQGIFNLSSSKGFKALAPMFTGKKPPMFIPPTTHNVWSRMNRLRTKTASDDENTPFVFKPKKVEDKPLTDEQDVNKLAIQLGVSTISVGMLAILALKLRKM